MAMGGTLPRMEDSPAYVELEFAQTYHEALQKICGALCSVSLFLTLD